MRWGRCNPASTMGRRRAPTRRSRGAALDADLGRLKRGSFSVRKEAKAVRVEMKADLEGDQLLERDADRLRPEAGDADAATQKSRPPKYNGAARQAAREGRGAAPELRDDVVKRRSA